MMQNTQSRKWQLTINAPLEKGFTHERIKEELQKLKSLIYWCMADEMGSTYHIHIYICFSSAVRFSTLKNRFNEAHLEIARGTSEQNRNYIAKAGKWENDKKHGTSIPGTFEEYGELPVERQGARNDLADLYDLKYVISAVMKLSIHHLKNWVKNIEFINVINKNGKVHNLAVTFYSSHKVTAYPLAK